MFHLYLEMKLLNIKRYVQRKEQEKSRRDRNHRNCLNMCDSKRQYICSENERSKRLGGTNVKRHCILGYWIVLRKKSPEMSVYCFPPMD